MKHILFLFSYECYVSFIKFCLCIDLLSVAHDQRESYDHRESDILIGMDIRN